MFLPYPNQLSILSDCYHWIHHWSLSTPQSYFHKIRLNQILPRIQPILLQVSISVPISYPLLCFHQNLLPSNIHRLYHTKYFPNLLSIYALKTWSYLTISKSVDPNLYHYPYFHYHLPLPTPLDLHLNPFHCHILNLYFYLFPLHFQNLIILFITQCQRRFHAVFTGLCFHLHRERRWLGQLGHHQLRIFSKFRKKKATR